MSNFYQEDQDPLGYLRQGSAQQSLQRHVKQQPQNGQAKLQPFIPNNSEFIQYNSSDYELQQRNLINNKKVFQNPYQSRRKNDQQQDIQNPRSRGLVGNVWRLISNSLTGCFQNCFWREKDKKNNVIILKQLEKDQENPTKKFEVPSRKIANELQKTGDVQKSRSNYQEAWQHFKKILAIRICSVIANTLEKIGDAKNGQNYEEAREHYDKSLQIKMHLLGSESSEVANLLQKIGDVHHHLQKSEQAQEYYKKSLKIKAGTDEFKYTEVANILKKIQMQKITSRPDSISKAQIAVVEKKSQNIIIPKTEIFSSQIQQNKDQLEKSSTYEQSQTECCQGKRSKTSSLKKSYQKHKKTPLKASNTKKIKKFQKSQKRNQQKRGKKASNTKSRSSNKCKCRKGCINPRKCKCLLKRKQCVNCDCFNCKNKIFTKKQQTVVQNLLASQHQDKQQIENQPSVFAQIFSYSQQLITGQVNLVMNILIDKVVDKIDLFLEDMSTNISLQEKDQIMKRNQQKAVKSLNKDFKFGQFSYNYNQESQIQQKIDIENPQRLRNSQNVGFDVFIQRETPRDQSTLAIIHQDINKQNFTFNIDQYLQ